MPYINHNDTRHGFAKKPLLYCKREKRGGGAPVVALPRRKRSDGHEGLPGGRCGGQHLRAELRDIDGVEEGAHGRRERQLRRCGEHLERRGDAREISGFKGVGRGCGNLR